MFSFAWRSRQPGKRPPDGMSFILLVATGLLLLQLLPTPVVNASPSAGRNVSDGEFFGAGPSTNSRNSRVKHVLRDAPETSTESIYESAVEKLNDGVVTPTNNGNEKFGGGKDKDIRPKRPSRA